MTGTERLYMESVLQTGLLPLYTWNSEGKGVNVGAINGKGGQLVPLSMPVVVNPGILDPKEFIDQVVNVRIPNPFMPDTPQRIATDTSQKLPIRFGQTIQAYLKRPDLKLEDLKVIPLVFAGWCRYVMGIGDSGAAFDPSPDPLLDSVQQTLKGVSLGSTIVPGETLKPLLSNQGIFGVDLYAVGMAETVEKLFQEMIAAPGAVRKVLHRVVQ